MTKKKKPPRLKGRPKNLPDDRFVEVRGEHLAAALKVAGLTLQGASNILSDRGTPVSFPVLSRLISGANKRTRQSILLKIAEIVGGISSEWLSGEQDEVLDEAFENERRGELEPDSVMTVPITLTYVIETQRLTEWIHTACRRDGAEALDWSSAINMALNLSHARAQWRGTILGKTRATFREFNDFAKSAAAMWRMKLAPWLTGIERLGPADVVQRHTQIVMMMRSRDMDGGSLEEGFPRLPAA